MMRAHKIELVPTPEQETYFRKACGTARFTYNWGLARWDALRTAGQTPSVLALSLMAYAGNDRTTANALCQRAGPE